MISTFDVPIKSSILFPVIIGATAQIALDNTILLSSDCVSFMMDRMRFSIIVNDDVSMYSACSLEFP